MGLGTGGVAVIAPSPDGSVRVPSNDDHFVKLPYTPLQFPALLPPQAEDLSGTPLVVLPLHSHLAPACCAALASGNTLAQVPSVAMDSTTSRFHLPSTQACGAKNFRDSIFMGFLGLF